MRRCTLLLLLLAAAAGSCTAEVCPDGRRCWGGSCCPSDDAAVPYGCCPYIGGICCADMRHCCPINYWCDLMQQKCLPGSEGAAAGLPVLGLGGGGGGPLTVATSSGDHPCPGGKKTCGSSATCCEMASGEYACCPEPNAVCCDDHIHCCPQGTKCDVKARTCLEEKRHTFLNFL